MPEHAGDRVRALSQWLCNGGFGSGKKLAQVGLVTAISVACAEQVKHLLASHLSVWEAHSITIVVATIASLAGTRWSVGKNTLTVEAKAASAAKSAFLSTMSRELRTPLNVVFGMADVLGETELSIEQRRYVTMMINNGEELRKVIDGLLDIAKSEKVLVSEGDQSWIWLRTIPNDAPRWATNSAGLLRWFRTVVARSSSQGIDPNVKIAEADISTSIYWRLSRTRIRAPKISRQFDFPPALAAAE